MLRQPALYEKQIFDIVKQYNNCFYYESISREINKDIYKLKIEKNSEEMVGYAVVHIKNGCRINYEIRYNRIVNLDEGYTLIVPGCKVG